MAGHHQIVLCLCPWGDPLISSVDKSREALQESINQSTGKGEGLLGATVGQGLPLAPPSGRWPPRGDTSPPSWSSTATRLTPVATWVPLYQVQWAPIESGMPSRSPWRGRLWTRA